MQGIFDAIQMIDNIQTNNNLHINGVMIYNSVSKKGRGSVYVRTSFNFVSNVGFYPENEYISYPLDVDSDIRGNKTNELQYAANETFEKQKRDIKKLQEKILSIFPKAEICVILSPYYCFYDNCIITGVIGYQEVHQPIINSELKRYYDNVLRYLNDWKQDYLKRVHQSKINPIENIVKEEIKNLLNNL